MSDRSDAESYALPAPAPAVLVAVDDDPLVLE